jgi:glycosyltransferase involved in cell wall biosynthesis
MISFIVPAHNEEALLGETLASLDRAGQAAPVDYEIIVVDDASTDRTAAIALEHGARVVSVHHRQIAATRNSGARAAHGGWFVFVDADTKVPADTVQAACRALQGGAIGGGSLVRFSGPVPLYARLMIGTLLPLLRLMGVAAGCFFFCTREAFEAVGGFDERLFAGEEAFMSRSLRRQGRFVLLREWVVTSGRKVRTHTAWEIFRVMLRVSLRPRRLMQRDGMEVWYGERRRDPADT